MNGMNFDDSHSTRRASGVLIDDRNREKSVVGEEIRILRACVNMNFQILSLPWTSVDGTARAGISRWLFTNSRPVGRNDQYARAPCSRSRNPPPLLCHATPRRCQWPVNCEESEIGGIRFHARCTCLRPLRDYRLPVRCARKRRPARARTWVRAWVSFCVWKSSHSSGGGVYPGVFVPAAKEFFAKYKIIV